MLWYCYYSGSVSKCMFTSAFSRLLIIYYGEWWFCVFRWTLISPFLDFLDPNTGLKSFPFEFYLLVLASLCWSVFTIWSYPALLSGFDSSTTECDRYCGKISISTGRSSARSSSIRLMSRKTSYMFFVNSDLGIRKGFWNLISFSLER